MILSEGYRLNLKMGKGFAKAPDFQYSGELRPGKQVNEFLCINLMSLNFDYVKRYLYLSLLYQH